MTDTFTWRTRKTAQGTETARTLQAQFGDGYKQIAGMGINDKQETWNLDWTGTRQEAAALRAFLMSHVTKSFWWTTPWGEKKAVQNESRFVQRFIPYREKSHCGLHF